VPSSAAKRARTPAHGAANTCCVGAGKKSGKFGGPVFLLNVVVEAKQVLWAIPARLYGYLQSKDALAAMVEDLIRHIGGEAFSW
jgi:hypothetical protein